jgi:hypothetical protein
MLTDMTKACVDVLGDQEPHALAHCSEYSAREDQFITAVAVSFDHLPKPPNLPLNAAEAGQKRITLLIFAPEDKLAVENHSLHENVIPPRDIDAVES